VNKFSKAKSDGNVCTDMFVGMDLHKSYLQVAVLDDKGKVLKNSRIHNDLSKVGRFFDRIGGSGNSSDVKVVMESSCVWYNIYEYLSEERQLDVSLSNPFKTRAIASAKIKTDKLDALKLADLLRGGYIAKRYVPDRKIMDLRLAFSRASVVEVVVSSPLIFSVISLFTAVGSCSFIFAGDIGSLASYLCVESYSARPVLSLEPTTVSLVSFNLSLTFSATLLIFTR
jgi:Transposase